MLYWIGSGGGKSTYSNPVDSGQITITSAPPKLDSDPIKYFVGRELKRVVLSDSPGGWFCIDLRTVRFLPTHYTYRHYNSKDSHAVRNWTLAGSSDGSVWTTLREHSDDATITKVGQAATFALDISKFVPLAQIVSEFYSRSASASASAGAGAGAGGAGSGGAADIKHASPMEAAGAAFAAANNNRYPNEKVSAAGSGGGSGGGGGGGGGGEAQSIQPVAAIPNSALPPPAPPLLGYRYFRIASTGKNSSEHFYNLCGSGFELYGILNPTVRSADDPPPVNPMSAGDAKDVKNGGGGGSVEGQPDGEDGDDGDDEEYASGSEEEDELIVGGPGGAGASGGGGSGGNSGGSGSGSARGGGLNGTTRVGDAGVVMIPDEDEATEGESSTDHLRRVLTRIGVWSECGAACLREKIDVSVLKILGDAELVTLLPLLVPRTKLKAWQKQQKALERRKMNAGTRTGIKRVKSGGSAAAAAAAPPTDQKSAKHQPKRERIDRTCVICLDNESDVVILDCMHLCLCKTCATKFTDPKTSVCPNCRKPVKEVRHVYA